MAGRAARNGTSEVQRASNDRLFLDLVRRTGRMSKADLTRASGLSAQSATVIVNRLVGEGLLRAERAVRGRVGQPSTPYAIDPEGASSIGIKIGRRSLEVVLMSFDYRIKQRIIRHYDYPRLAEVRRDTVDYVERLLSHLTSAQRGRIAGIGLALPDGLSDWESTIGAPSGAMTDWDQADLRTDLARAFGLPTHVLNDGSAACLAEAMTANAAGLTDMVYLYVGTFIGGGLTIGGQLFNGTRGLAGAIGSMPVAVNMAQGRVPQMIEGASLHQLEKAAETAGVSARVFYADAPLEPAAQAVFERWKLGAARHIAFASISSHALVDPQSVVIDSSLSRALTADLVKAVRDRVLTDFDERGLSGVNVTMGGIGSAARAIGSGVLPFLSEFSLDGSPQSARAGR